MPGVTGQLADVIDMLHNAFDLQVRRGGCRSAAHPAGVHHPGIESHPDHGLAPDQREDLFIAELPVSGHERPAIVVAGPNRAVEQVQRLPEGLLRQVRGVQHNAQLAHFAQ